MDDSFKINEGRPHKQLDFAPFVQYFEQFLSFGEMRVVEGKPISLRVSRPVGSEASWREGRLAKQSRLPIRAPTSSEDRLQSRQERWNFDITLYGCSCTLNAVIKTLDAVQA